MRSSVSEEEKKNKNTLEETKKVAENTSGSEGSHSFFKKVLPWFAIGVFAVVAVTITWWATPTDEYVGELELVTFPHFARLIFALGWVGLFFTLLRKLPLWARGFVFVVFFFPVALSTYLQKFYGAELNTNFVVDCLNTHWQEARAFISLHAIATLLGFIALTFAVAWFVGKVPAKLPRSKIFTSVLVAVFVLSLLPETSRAGIFPAKVVCRTAKAVHWYYTGRLLEVGRLVELEDESQEVSLVPTEISHVSAVPVVILHIGETARADHAPFNGYVRNTMPNMLREAEAGNLVSFPKCVSFADRTTLSMRGILSPSTVLDNAFQHSTFLPVLNQSGICTCAFFSSINADKYTYVRYSWIGQQFGKMQEIVYTSEPALSLLPKIREKLAEDAEKEPPQERFYLYYGEGSHQPFIFYDYDKHAVFKPNGIRKYNDERDVNNYDNTFIATDEFCAGFIDALRNENAIYIFVGDHGEMLGEDGLQGRPYRRPESRHVLFFIWVSDKFKAENPELWATLVRNRERLGVVSHDFVYNSVLHLFSLKTPFYDERADLFSDSAEPFPTEMPKAESFWQQ